MQVKQTTSSVNLSKNGKSHTLRCSAVLGPTKLDLLIKPNKSIKRKNLIISCCHYHMV